MTSNESKRRSVLVPGSFAKHLGDYLAHLVTNAGGDMSGRWLSARIDRGRSYCAKIITSTQAMTTNDIALVAELFGTNPYQFVRDARSWNATTDGGVDHDPRPESVGTLHSLDDYRSKDVRGAGQNSGIEDESDIPENIEDELAGQYAADPKGDDPEDHTP